jgi:hypothetical protein
VRDFIKHIPKERQQNNTWQVIARRLASAAGGGSSADEVSIALQMAFQLERIEYRKQTD